MSPYIYDKRVWAKCVDFPAYAISDDGRVMRIAGGRGATAERILVPFIDKNGYPCVRLCVNGHKRQVFVHRLVARAFVDNPKDKPHVNHKNGNKRDFSVSNLEWVTPLENAHHALWEMPEVNRPPVYRRSLYASCPL